MENTKLRKAAIKAGVILKPFSSAESHCWFQGETGTNGLHGGKSSYGGKLYFSLEAQGGADWKISVNKYRDKMEMLLSGDCEIETLIQAFENAVRELNSFKSVMRGPLPSWIA